MLSEAALDILQETLKAGAVFARANRDFSVGTKIGEAWSGFRGKGAVAAVATADHSMTAALKKVKDEAKATKIKAYAYSSMVIVTVSAAVSVCQ